MVLSNKKLKQKLRAVKAALIVESETRNNLTGKDTDNSENLDSKTSDSLRIFLNPEVDKPMLSKKEKRRLKAQSCLQRDSDDLKHRDISTDIEGEKEGEFMSDNVEVKKKRKRNESNLSKDVDKNKSEKLKRKKKSKNKRKPKKVEKELVKGDGVQQNESGVSGEQLVAKTDQGVNRKDVEAFAKVYVGGIPYYSSEDDIRSYFEGCGTITSVDCMEFPDTGKFRGIAIITFKTEAAAKRALALDGSDMGGLFLNIQPYKSTRVNKPSKFSPSVLAGYNRVYVGNLSWDITEEDLRELFSNCSVSCVRFGEDKDTKEFKGFAHVDFSDSLSLNMALKLDQNLVCGRPVRISCAVPKKGTVAKSMSMPAKNAVSEGKINGCGDKIEKINAVSEDKIERSEVSVVSSKISRRTCYECGERGHLSSSCLLSEDKIERINAVSEDKIERSEVSVVSSKIRRRTCYECGERGHLSSSCPNKQPVDSTNPGTV